MNVALCTFLELRMGTEMRESARFEYQMKKEETQRARNAYFVHRKDHGC